MELSATKIFVAQTYYQQILLQHFISTVAMTLILLQRFSSCPKKNELKLDNNPNLKHYVCNGCKEYGSNGMRYRCKDCNYSFHKDCMFSKPTITHEIFKDFIFKFYELQPPLELYSKRTKIYCNACGKHIKGFIYHCPEEDLNLHPCCLNLKKEFQIGQVKFHLRETKLKCKFCNWIDLLEIEVWLYVSDCVEYNFHVSCITGIIVKELENEITNILALRNLGLPIHRGLKISYNFWFIPLLFIKIALISKNKTS